MEEEVEEGRGRGGGDEKEDSGGEGVGMEKEGEVGGGRGKGVSLRELVQIKYPTSTHGLLIVHSRHSSACLYGFSGGEGVQGGAR